MNKRHRNILVTGADGFIGSHLCEELVINGYTVFGLVRSKKIERLKYLLSNKKFHLQRGNITSFNLINKTIKTNKINIIFHLAAVLPGAANLDDPFPLFNVNIGGTLNLLNAAYKNKVDKFIYASTMSVYAIPPRYLPVDENHQTLPLTIYGASKLGGELFCNAYSKEMNIIILRYGGAYGKKQHEHYASYRFIKQALNNEPITIYGSGTQTTDFTYIDDIVRGTVLAMKKNRPGVYNIGSGKETSIKELAQKIVKLTGSKSKIILTKKGTDRPFRFFLDIKKAKRILNYSPASLNKGLSEYISKFNTKI